MSFLNQRISLGIKSAYQWWRITTYLVLGLMAGSLIMSSIIVYNYTFRTLEDAHTIVLLNTDKVVNNVNMETYNKAVSTVEKKNAPSEFNRNLRNVFIYGNYSTTTQAFAPATTSDYDSNTIQ